MNEISDLQTAARKALALIALMPSLPIDSVMRLHLTILTMGANSETLGSYLNEYQTSLQYVMNRLQSELG